MAAVFSRETNRFRINSCLLLRTQNNPNLALELCLEIAFFLSHPNRHDPNRGRRFEEFNHEIGGRLNRDRYRLLMWLSLLQHAFSVCSLTIVAYAAAVRTLSSRGILLAWYDHAGLLVVFLLSALLILTLSGFLLAAAHRVGTTVQHRFRKRI
jgi:hypothetical protein